MADFEAKFADFSERMRRENLPDLAIQTFRHYYRQVVEGATGLIPEQTITPVEELPDLETFGPEWASLGKEHLDRTIVIKLNGGLGTSMGLSQAKSLLVVKDGLSFLEIIARQAEAAGVPLLLMNSFATRDDSLNALKDFKTLSLGLPQDFLQHKVPKVVQADLRPADHPKDRSLEWCPPGHGDLYTALATSGVLSQILEQGIRYAFVSNSDNLGASIQEEILGFLASKKIPFLMEVADRTEMDRKGGHLARMKDGTGRFVLREAAQCGEEDLESFQNIRLHRFFNTNNLWIDLVQLEELLKRKKNLLNLPLIRNEKRIDPRNPASTLVFQLETAMGSAISVFDQAAAVRVPRTRFSPVKNCVDLLAVRSDLTVLTTGYHLNPAPSRTIGPFEGDLDPRYYGRIRDFEARFPATPPSLLNCKSLKIEGDFIFGSHVKLEGDVEMINSSERAHLIPDGTCIEGIWRV